ncbi:MAG: TAT-variant-translocated molybdopterin oxidoreductase, partial [Chloracidobacterium sp.]|nr:TAT-variant-translocated molybdopterin oxidoreductase [Chloracidobacterium sp.]
MTMRDKEMDIAAIRARLATSQGKEYWRSLEELAESEAFQESLRREFPVGASEWSDMIDRRRFMRLMGASLALAGLTACTRQPAETIVPYVHPAVEITPGEPLHFATAMPLSGAAEGLLVESHEGRPTKIEGNPNHPASLGATSLFAQASVLTLYNPDRARTITNIGEISSWGALGAELQQAISEKRARQGAGLRIMTGTVSSPTLANQIKTLLAQFPAAKWHQYEPINQDNAMAGARMAFGEPLNAIHRFENADVILSLDADFLACGPASVRYAREFAGRRRLLGGDRRMNRLYVVEGSMTNTGAVADHRFPLRPSEIESFAREVATALGIQAGGQTGGVETKWRSWVDPLARDLKRRRGRSMVIAGDSQPPLVHALSAAMNQALGAAGNTVIYTAPVEAGAVDQTQGLSELASDMDSGLVDLLVIVGGNPVYDAPADLKFSELMSKVKTRVHLSLFHDETSELCHWHVPESHYLETWSDARAYDGAVTIIQPLIAPLYESKSAHEMLAALSGRPQQSSYEIVR